MKRTFKEPIIECCYTNSSCRHTIFYSELQLQISVNDPMKWNLPYNIMNFKWTIKLPTAFSLLCCIHGISSYHTLKIFKNRIMEHVSVKEAMEAKMGEYKQSLASRYLKSNCFTYNKIPYMHTYIHMYIILQVVILK